MSAPIVDQRVHRDDVVEFAEAGVEHVAHPKLDAAGSALLRQPFARERDQRRRQIDRDDIRSALGRLDAQRAGAAAGIQQARSAQIRADSRAASSACASRPARTVARILLSGAVEVRRAQACTAVRSK